MGKNKAKLKAAKARYEQEVYSYQKSVIGAFKEVNDAIVTIHMAKDIRRSQEKLEAASRKYVQLAELQYINGVTNYIDVLDAQRGYLDAQISLNNAVLDELLSVVYLYKALGGRLSGTIEAILKRIRPAITYMKVGRGEKYKLKSHLPFNLNQL